jgi:hypothetical protein
VHVAARPVEGGDVLRIVEQPDRRGDVEVPLQGPQFGHVAHLVAHTRRIALLQPLCHGDHFTGDVESEHLCCTTPLELLP